MHKIKVLLLFLLGTFALMTFAYAKNIEPMDYSLMTARDQQEKSTSNITITNRTNQSITVSGLYIASFDVNDCSVCTGGLLSGNNFGGAVVSLVNFKPNQSVAVGQNYLYNMIYNGIYYLKTNISSPCSLPGCSWPGDNYEDVRGWCISINATSLDSDYTYSDYINGSHPPANTPAYGDAVNSDPYDYKYALVDPSTLGTGNPCLGPITCDDKTLTCKVSNPQDQSFQAYE